MGFALWVKMKSNRVIEIAVVGLGPRGLGALEALFERCGASGASLKVDVFDPSPCPGAGPNFDPNEPGYGLLNIPHRDIAIRPPEGSSVGSFANWLNGDVDPDDFPSRADLGRYLEARRTDLFDRRIADNDCDIQLIADPVEKVTADGDRWRLQIAGQDNGPYDEVLLTLGQPAVHPDDQLALWQDHAAATDATVAQAYPAGHLAQAAAHWKGRTVAIRGLGLSTYDVLRGLTLGQGGAFTGAGYLPSGGEPACILPFSLDGKPPYPKPETEALDAIFTPTREETHAFSTAATEAVAAEPAAAADLLTAALIPPVLRILAAEGLDRAQVAEWLAKEWSEPGSQDSAAPLDTLQYGIDMGRGNCPPSIGYTVGQVWRKWQDQWRAAFNPGYAKPATAGRLVGFDEGLKRYSYGPPLSSAQELLALVKAGLVDLSCVSDPDISTVPQGWQLNSGTTKVDVSVMVDAVLPSPDLATLSGPPLPDLIVEGYLTPLAPDLAAATAPDGRLRDAVGDLVPGLCLLGRLALGSVTAADSLHDCFGQSADRWADGVLKRHG